MCNFISFNYVSSAAVFRHAVTRTAIMRILVLGDRFGEGRGKWSVSVMVQEL